jgi:pyruvate dehydrogenase E1 component alpha subunit
MHTTADDPSRYRSEEDVEAWKKRDPLLRFKRYLEQKKAVSRGFFEEVETAIQDEIQAAVDQAEAEMKKMDDPMLMFDHLYAELPPYLSAQKKAFSRWVDRDSGREEDRG